MSGGVLVKQRIISLLRPAGLQISYSTPSVLVRLILEACPEAALSNLLLGTHLGFLFVLISAAQGISPRALCMAVPLSYSPRPLLLSLRRKQI